MKAILILISHFPISNLGTIHTIRISWMFGIHFIEWQKINTTAMIKPNLAIAISFPRRFEWTWVVTEPFRFRIFSEKLKPLYDWSMIIGSSYNLVKIMISFGRKDLKSYLELVQVEFDLGQYLSALLWSKCWGLSQVQMVESHWQENSNKRHKLEHIRCSNAC